MYDSESRRSKKGISFGPVLIIVLGIIFLLNNFGVLPWEIWENIWKFWPILLILFGVEVLLGRASSIRTIIFLLVLIFLIPLLLILNPLTGNVLANESVDFEKPLGNLVKTEINMALPSNNLKLSALEAQSTKALVASVKYSKILPKPDIVEERKFGEANYSFEQKEKYLPFVGNLGSTVQLKLSRLISNSLLIQANTGVFDLNLEELNVPLLDIDSGASQISISYAKNANNKTFIKTTAAKVTLKIPIELQAEIRTGSVIKDIKIDGKRFKKQDDSYSTAAFAGAVNKVQIEISGSASSIEVK